MILSHRSRAGRISISIIYYYVHAHEFRCSSVVPYNAYTIEDTIYLGYYFADVCGKDSENCSCARKRRRHRKYGRAKRLGPEEPPPLALGHYAKRNHGALATRLR